jgi:hypothetical protein
MEARDQVDLLEVRHELREQLVGGAFFRELDVDLIRAATSAGADHGSAQFLNLADCARIFGQERGFGFVSIEACGKFELGSIERLACQQCFDLLWQRAVQFFAGSRVRGLHDALAIEQHDRRQAGDWKNLGDRT